MTEKENIETRRKALCSSSGEFGFETKQTSLDYLESRRNTLNRHSNKFGFGAEQTKVCSVSKRMSAVCSGYLKYFTALYKQNFASFFKRRKKKGQATLESVLLMVLLLGLAITILQDNMREGEWMKKIIGTPGAYIRGMSLAGVWGRCTLGNFPTNIGCDDVMRKHPNHVQNSITQVKGDDVTQ